MTRPFAFAALGLAIALAFVAAPAAAQTWGQPLYIGAYGHGVGGTPLSEIETRSYVETGRWADGYSEQPYIHVPARPHAAGYGGYGYRSYRSGYGAGYGYGYSSRGHGYRSRREGSRVGYRDAWGYNDDRPPAWRSRNDRDCGCGDVYLYDH